MEPDCLAKTLVLLPPSFGEARPLPGEPGSDGVSLGREQDPGGSLERVLRLNMRDM